MTAPSYRRLHILTAPGTGWGRITRDGAAIDRALARLGAGEAGQQYPLARVDWGKYTQVHRQVISHHKGEG